MKKHLAYGAVWVVFIIGLASTLVPEGSALSNISLVLTLLAFAPFLLTTLLVACFMIYHAVAHGDPFHESRTGNWLRPSDRPREAVVMRKRITKWCPVCEAKTTCRNSYNKWTKTAIHVQGSQF